jgi:hypothetical protein
MLNLTGLLARTILLDWLDEMHLDPNNYSSKSVATAINSFIQDTIYSEHANRTFGADGAILRKKKILVWRTIEFPSILLLDQLKSSCWVTFCWLLLPFFSFSVAK